MSLPDRQQHQQEIRAYLQKHFSSGSWEFSNPRGSGHETYFARSSENRLFVKVGAKARAYLALAAVGLTPAVLAVDTLEDGSALLVQAYIEGRSPTRKDYRNQLEQFATAINQVHHHPELKLGFPQVSSELYRVVGLDRLVHIQHRWERFKAQVPKVVDFVDGSLDYLGKQVGDFQGQGLVASHNDICNANWLISNDGQLYLIDLESMALEDPAVDIGATLWWYYPLELRQRFLLIAGHANDKAFETRMHVRMAMHCLSISLPRAQSFDEFEPASFEARLTDFRAILAGEENPQGYEN